MALVEARDLRLALGGRTILDGIGFAIEPGEVVGLLGPNGAGKTTTLSILATLRRPDAGTALVDGIDVTDDPAAVRRILGVVPQSIALYPSLTARENLRFFARVLGLDGTGDAAVAGALDLVGLEERADDVVGTFSGGMQRRLNLACGLLGLPRVLLLDEPTVGVDPQSRERILDAIRAQVDREAAVLYSTHQLDEAERLCDRVVLIDRGRVVATGSPTALLRERQRRLQLRMVTRAALPAGWAGDLPVERAGDADAAVARGVETHVVLHDAAAAGAVLARVATAGSGLVEFHLHEPSLQDLFLELTGKALRD